MFEIGTIASAATLILLVMQEWRVGLVGARAQLVKTLQDTVAAQEKRIALLEADVARLTERLEDCE